MFSFDLNDTVIVDQTKVLESALSTNPKTQKALQKLIRQVVLEARKQVVEHIKFKHGDPRGAAQAVRSSVYKKILGGNLNIYNSRKAHGTTDYVPQRKGSTGRGGNRRVASFDTRRIAGYSSLDRGFILRWIDAGTKERSIRFSTNDKRIVDKWNKHPNTGNRGSIQAARFFAIYGEDALMGAGDHLSVLIETELANILNKTK